MRSLATGSVLVLLAAACAPPPAPTATTGRASSYDPHPGNLLGEGPWFEGWYSRISDPGRGRSLAVVVGSQLPAGEAYRPGAPLPGYLGVLWSDGSGAPTQTFNYYPETTSVEVDGHPVTTESAPGDPPHFRWSAPGLGTITESRIELAIPGALDLQAEFGERVPWDEADRDDGPEGLLALLPLPLDWFVFSLASPARYALQLRPQGEMLSGDGFAHLEKNWGSAFPHAWIWAEAVSVDGRSQFSLGGGPLLSVAGVAIEPWIAGLRTPELNWNLSFSDPGSVITRSISACAGTFALTFRDPLRTVVIEAHAPPSTFGKVAIPTAGGFAGGLGAESFSTQIEVRAYRHNPLGGLFGLETQVSAQTFTGAALEFGGDFSCVSP